MSGRPRAIVATPRLPWPVDDGGRLGLWQILVATARHWDVTLLTLATPDEIRAGAHATPGALASVGVRTVAVPHRPWSVTRGVLADLTGPWPYVLARYRNPAFEDALRREVDRGRAELVVLNHLHLATYAPAARPAAVVLRQHNLEHVWLERYAQLLRAGVRRAYVTYQARRMRAAERSLCEGVDLVLAVQPDEADALRQLAPGARVETLSAAVDFHRFLERRPVTPPALLICGTFDRGSNADGARRFLERSWPRVRRSVPEARLRLVGKGLPAELRALASERGAEPVGYVEEFPPELAGAAMLVVPLWVGAGARLKIIEALAAKTPVVTTTLGAEGLGLEHDPNVLIGETEAALADAVVRILSDPALASRIAAAGHRHALEHFSEDVVGERMVRLCTEAVANRAAAGNPAPCR